MYKNILIPIEIDHEEGIRKAFSAARLLADEGAELTLIHVMETIPGYVRGRISDDVLEERQNSTEQSLNELAAQLNGAKAKLLTGHAGNTITAFADENDVDCIILSSHKPNIENFFIGSTANRVVHHASCSVHVIR